MGLKFHIFYIKLCLVFVNISLQIILEGAVVATMMLAMKVIYFCGLFYDAVSVSCI
jgi:hypothetical protein